MPLPDYEPGVSRNAGPEIGVRQGRSESLDAHGSLYLLSVSLAQGMR
jgi:hypothetical protein